MNTGRINVRKPFEEMDGVKIGTAALAYGIVMWLIIWGLASAEPWIVVLSVGFLLPAVSEKQRPWAIASYAALVVMSGIFGTPWALMGGLLFVPVILEVPRPGIVCGAAMFAVLLGMSIQQEIEVREREERLRSLIEPEGDVH